MTLVLPGKPKSYRKTKIDVLIPAIEKDLGTLPFVIDAVRKQSAHVIGNIYVVSPLKPSIMELCRKKGCKFVDEKKVLPFTKDAIHYRSAKWDRAGWLYQQLLKLCGDRICKEAFFLVIDADTVLIRPHRFRSGGKTVLYCRNWSQDEYFNSYRRLMKRRATAKVSFVTHYMLFERAKLAEMKRLIEKQHGKKWYQAILSSIDRKKQFGFSEYETYGNFLYARYRDQLHLTTNRNKGLQMSVRRMSGQRWTELRGKYRSLSFHKRGIYKRK
ncbi:DUF6492 family protein [Paenibacillus harenae]|uniref:Glycosyltransferase family 2 protein n=1 Tax=Paenibacillus harenae TaxID=306543 RepID=A0ABT9U2A3_PAEHA|nr:DUF6492 family protein [Paenibacillus harenae]MDQ0113397.1 hypothetical protein [Paenibacillus harenae]